MHVYVSTHVCMYSRALRGCHSEYSGPLALPAGFGDERASLLFCNPAFPGRGGEVQAADEPREPSTDGARLSVYSLGLGFTARAFTGSKT